MSDIPTEPKEPNWSEVAKGLLKAELKRRNLTYAGLSNALAEVGSHETEASLRNKISRGSFSAAFFLQCLNAIGCGMLYLDNDRTRVRSPRYDQPDGLTKGIGIGSKEPK